MTTEKKKPTAAEEMTALRQELTELKTLLQVADDKLTRKHLEMQALEKDRDALRRRCERTEAIAEQMRGFIRAHHSVREEVKTPNYGYGDGYTVSFVERYPFADVDFTQF